MKRMNWFVFLGLLALGSLPAYAAEIQIEAEKLSETVYRLICCGTLEVNATVSIGEDGILLVDTGMAGADEAIRSELQSMGAGDIRYIINTHLHQDHTGGNSIARESTTIIAHANVLKRLSSGDNIFFRPPAEQLPSVLVEDEYTLEFNGEEIRIIHFPVSHTDGDLVVYFPESKIVCLGDLLFSDRFPFVDLNNGGTLDGYTASMNEFLDRFPADVTYIAGHGRNYNREDIREYHRMLAETTALVVNRIEDGKPLNEAEADRVLKDWSSWETGFISDVAWAETIYNSRFPTPVEIKKSLSEELYKIAGAADGKTLVKKYRELKHLHPDDYDFGEARLNLLGYYLMWGERTQDAVAVFKENVHEYPASGNVYDSLGEAYMKLGKIKAAVRNYEKSLQYDPGSQNAKDMLQKLAVMRTGK